MTFPNFVFIISFEKSISLQQDDIYRKLERYIINIDVPIL